MVSYLCLFNIEISLEMVCGFFPCSFNIDISDDMAHGFLPLLIQYRTTYDVYFGAAVRTRNRTGELRWNTSQSTSIELIPKKTMALMI